MYGNLYSTLLGARPYVLIQLNGDDSADVEVGGFDVLDPHNARDMARTMRHAARDFRKEVRRRRRLAREAGLV